MRVEEAETSAKAPESRQNLRLTPSLAGVSDFSHKLSFTGVFITQLQAEGKQANSRCVEYEVEGIRGSEGVESHLIYLGFRRD